MGAFPEGLEMHTLRVSRGVTLKVARASMRHCAAFNHRSSSHGALVVHFVTSSVMPHRVIDWGQFDANFDLPVYPGWTNHEIISMLLGRRRVPVGRRWPALRRTWKMPSRITRRSTVRGRPPHLSGESKGAKMAHSRSLRSEEG